MKKTISNFMLPGILAVCLALALTSSAHDLYWSGDGVWDASAQNWGSSSGGPYNAAIWDNSAPDSAIFEGAAGTVKRGEAITAGGLSFNVDGYSILGNGNAITLAGGQTITIGSERHLYDHQRHQRLERRMGRGLGRQRSRILARLRQELPDRPGQRTAHSHPRAEHARPAADRRRRDPEEAAYALSARRGALRPRSVSGVQRRCFIYSHEYRSGIE